MSAYKLIYFNGKGLGEMIRYVFVVSGVKYEDFRIDYPSDDWQKLKPNTLFGQLPILEINENNGTIVKLAQSNTIARFLARRFNLAGKTDVEQAKAEMILDYFTDLHSLFQQAYYVDNEQVKLEKMKIFSQEQFPHHISLLEKLLEQQNSKYLVSDELTVADLCLVSKLDRLQLAFSFDINSILDKYPLLKAVNQRVNENPRLKTYKENVPITEF